MWKQIAHFELKQGFRKISLWVYFLIFFAIACLIAHVLGGAFTGASMGNQGTKINSPLMIAEFQVVFSLIGVLIFAALFASSMDASPNSIALSLSKSIIRRLQPSPP